MFCNDSGRQREKRKDGGEGGETSVRRVDSVTPVSNLPVAAAGASQPKGVRMEERRNDAGMASPSPILFASYSVSHIIHCVCLSVCELHPASQPSTRSRRDEGREGWT